LQTVARRGLFNDLLQCCALYCEPASLSAAPTDSRRMFAWIFIQYIILGWTNSPVSGFTNLTSRASVPCKKRWVWAGAASPCSFVENQLQYYEKMTAPCPGQLSAAQLGNVLRAHQPVVLYGLKNTISATCADHLEATSK
jgi:hypothetical protein